MNSHHLKPVSKIQHNQSFDSIPLNNQLASQVGQHGSKLSRGDQSKLIASGQSTIKGQHMTHHSSTHQALQTVAQANAASSSNNAG